MPRRPHRSRTLLVSALLVWSLAGCSGPSDVPATSTEPPPADETTKAAPRDDTGPAQAELADAAEQAVVEYFRVTDELFRDPQLDLQRLVDVASGTELEELRRQLQEARADGRRQVGAAVVASLEMTDISAGLPATADMEVCLDVGGIDVVDQDGVSVVTAAREPRSVVGLTLVQGPDQAWRVDQTQSEGVACAQA